MATSEGKFFVFEGDTGLKRFAMIGGFVIIAAAIGLVVAPRPVGLVVRPITTPAQATVSTSPMVAGDTTVAPSPSTEASTPAAPKTSSQPTPRTQSAITAAPSASVPQAFINLQIKSPAGQSSYSINASSVTDACNVLTAARDQGMIKSVTIDDSYQAVLKSAYVREINGYYNNWTFKVNGFSPKGCSLASVNKGDMVLWEYQ